VYIYILYKFVLFCLFVFHSAWAV